MARRTLTRGLLALATTVAAAAVWVQPSAAAADAPPAPVLTVPPVAYPPPADGIEFAGATGYLHDGGTSGTYRWTTYDGTDVPLAHQPLVPLDGALAHGAGSDTVISAFTTQQGNRLGFQDLAHGTSVDVPDPADYTPLGQFGAELLVRSTQSPYTLRLLSAGADGTLTDTPVTGVPGGSPQLTAGDTRSVVVSYGESDGRHLAVVDLATGVATPVPGVVTGTPQVFLGPDRIGWFNAATAQPVVHLIDRADPAAPGTTTQLPASVGTVMSARFAGRWIVTLDNYTYSSAYATDPSTGTSVRLPGEVTSQTFAEAPDGSVVAQGGPDTEHWATERITASGDDTPVVSALTPIPSPPARVTGLALSGGELYTGIQGGANVVRRRVTLGGSPSYGDQTAAGDRLTPEGPLTGTGNGYAQLAGELAVTDATGATHELNTGSTGSTLVAAGQNYQVYDTGSPAVQHVAPFDGSPFTRTPSAAAISGNTLWTAGASGALTATALPTRTTLRTVSTGDACTPTELQAAAGRWLYWACGTTGPAGVYDLTTGEDTHVPAGYALLGDGFVVRHDTASGRLLLTDVSDDTAAPDRVIADLPATGADDRGVTWSVDAFGGGVAWVDAGRNVDIADPGVARVPLAVLTALPPQSMAGDGIAWSPSWTLSRPAASATFTIANGWGRTIATAPATLIGSSVEGAQGPLTPNRAVPDSPGDRWNLTVTDTDGNRTTVSGPLAVDEDLPAYRGYDTWGRGSVVTLNSAGYLTTHQLGSDDMLSVSQGGTGWTTKATAVPFGDLNGDVCNDTLVRMSTGELRDYHTSCSPLSTPTHAYTSLGTGFSQYKWLGYSGDITGDGHPDLLAWSASTGDLYLLPGRSTGTLGARVLLKSDQTYVRFIAPGDVNGDGIGDLMAYDHAKTLWLMTGNGKGGFNARTQVFTNWGSGYNAMIGAGDLNGDGRPDIVERDSKGLVWANPVRADGTFGGRYEVAGGWQGYVNLF